MCCCIYRVNSFSALPCVDGHISVFSAVFVLCFLSCPVSSIAPHFPLGSSYPQDAADSYTVVGGDVSRWWVDLSNELKHYIEYGVWLEKETMKWRNTQIDCFFDKADGACMAFEWIGLTCYDKYVVSAVEGMILSLSTREKLVKGLK